MKLVGPKLKQAQRRGIASNKANAGSLAPMCAPSSPGMSVSYVARRAGVAPSLLFNWRRRMLEGGLQAVQADEDVVGTSCVRELERRVRELERLFGRKTMEVEILKEALDVARVKKPSLQLPSWNDRKDGSP